MNSHTVRKACKTLCEALGPDYAVGKRVDGANPDANASIYIPIVNKWTSQEVGKIEVLVTGPAQYGSVTVEGDDIWIESRERLGHDAVSTLLIFLLETLEKATAKAQKLTGRTPNQAKKVIYVRYGEE